MDGDGIGRPAGNRIGGWLSGSQCHGCSRAAVDSRSRVSTAAISARDGRACMVRPCSIRSRARVPGPLPWLLAASVRSRRTCLGSLTERTALSSPLRLATRTGVASSHICRARLRPTSPLLMLSVLPCRPASPQSSLGIDRMQDHQQPAPAMSPSSSEQPSPMLAVFMPPKPGLVIVEDHFLNFPPFDVMLAPQLLDRIVIPEYLADPYAHTNCSAM